MTHASATFTTTDDVCAALLAFVGSLRGSDHSEAVVIPALRVDGEVMEVRMTLNAESAFVVIPVDVDARDERALALASVSAVGTLQARTEKSGHREQR